MKKLFAIVAVIGAFTFGSIQLAQAQDAMFFCNSHIKKTIRKTSGKLYKLSSAWI